MIGGPGAIPARLQPRGLMVREIPWLSSQGGWHRCSLLEARIRMLPIRCFYGLDSVPRRVLPRRVRKKLGSPALLRVRHLPLPGFVSAEGFLLRRERFGEA